MSQRFNPEEMDKKKAKEVVRQLKPISRSVRSALKNEDEVLTTKRLQEIVAVGLEEVETSKRLLKLRRVDKDKLKEAGLDCFGLFVSTSSPSCNICPDQKECTVKYLANLQDDLSIVDKALAELEIAEVSKTTTKEAKKYMAAAAKKPVKTKKVKLKPIAYEADRRIFIVQHDAKTITKVTHGDVLGGKVLTSIVKQLPETFAELYNLLKKEAGAEFDLTPEHFVEEWIVGLRDLDPQFLKLEQDLTDEDRKHLNV